MMKAIKKWTTMALTLIMMFALALPAGAAGDNNTLTITSKTSGHTFQAYQVFDGDYYEGVLSNVTWGDDVDGVALLAALKADGNLGTHFTNCTTATHVAEVLSGEGSPFTDNSELLDDLADVVSNHLKASHTDSGAPSGQAPNFTYTITGLKDGYYFVNEADMSNANNNAYTKFMLQVVGDTTVAAKADVPTIDKSFAEGGNQGDASIGDEINFKLTSKVPNMDGYDKYFFVVHDTLSTGLTFKAGSVAVKVGDDNLTTTTDYTVTHSGQTLKIVLNNFIQYKDQTNADIEITYTATLNENALVGVEDNPNDVYLVYSNNPNVVYDGDNEPTEDDPVGETPHDKTYTYVTGLELKKVDPDRNPLTGAKFKIEGDGVKTVLVYKDQFTVDNENGTYWKLKDGTYTTTAPDGDSSDKYDDTETKYKRETVKDKVETSAGVAAEGYVDNDGILRFDGLSAGTYTITEMVAPDGYNLLDGPIQITISWSAPDTEGGDCTWAVSGVQGADVQNGIITLTIENDKGSTLPETGGIGTTIFYVVGGILVVGAGVLLVAKKRMNADNEK